MDAAATYVSEVTQTLHFAVRLSVHFEVLQITLRRKVALPSKIYKNQLPVSETLGTYLCTWYSCYINKYILKVLQLLKNRPPMVFHRVTLLTYLPFMRIKHKNLFAKGFIIENMSMMIKIKWECLFTYVSGL